MLKLSLVLLVASAHALLAASPPRVLAWDEEIAARKLALVCGESSIEITGMHPIQRTGPLRIKRTAPVFIRAIDKGPGPDGKPVDLACPISESVIKPLLVLLPDKAHATGLRVMVIDDNPAGFTWGSYRFLNATPKELVVQLEKKAVRVPSGWKSVDLDLGGDTRGIGARIALSESIEKPIYSAVWEYNKDVRTLCFLVPGDDLRLSPVAFKAVPEDRLTLQLESQAENPR